MLVSSILTELEGFREAVFFTPVFIALATTEFNQEIGLC